MEKNVAWIVLQLLALADKLTSNSVSCLPLALYCLFTFLGGLDGGSIDITSWWSEPGFAATLFSSSPKEHCTIAACPDTISGICFGSEDGP